MSAKKTTYNSLTELYTAELKTPGIFEQSLKDNQAAYAYLDKAKAFYSKSLEVASRAAEGSVLAVCGKKQSSEKLNELTLWATAHPRKEGR